MSTTNWQALGRVLVVRLDNIGDVVLLSPALRALRRAAPDAHVTLFCSPAGSTVAPLLPWVDETLVRRVVWQDASATMPHDPDREQALVDTLREGDYDAAFIFTSFSQSPHPPAYACYLAGIPVRVGQSKEFAGSLLSHAVSPPDDAVHQVDRALHLLDGVGIPADGTHLELAVPHDATARARTLLAQAGVDPVAPYVVLAPGASASARRYEPARFHDVAAGLAGATNLRVLVVGSERERGLIAAVADRIPGAVAFAGRTSVPELAAVIRDAALVLANNSSALHFADAFRRPVVVLYSGTELETQWTPRHTATRLLRRPTPCSPCYAFTCPYDMECLDIPPKDVIDAALDLLGQFAPPGGTKRPA